MSDVKFQNLCFAMLRKPYTAVSDAGARIKNDVSGCYFSNVAQYFVFIFYRFFSCVNPFCPQTIVKTLSPHNIVIFLSFMVIFLYRFHVCQVSLTMYHIAYIIYAKSTNPCPGGL